MPPNHCEDTCRAASEELHDYCKVIEISGIDSSWPENIQDTNNLYRLEAEAGAPRFRAGRPSYVSIPARRSGTTLDGRATKWDYYMYATTLNGFTEWLLDRNSTEDDGAADFVASADYSPQHINSDWSFSTRKSSIG